MASKVIKYVVAYNLSEAEETVFENGYNYDDEGKLLAERQLQYARWEDPPPHIYLVFCTISARRNPDQPV